MASEEKNIYEGYPSLSDVFGTQLKKYPEQIPTGFKMLDEILEGGLPAGLIVLGAISSLGKSTFCMQIAHNIASNGEPVIYFSLEMARREMGIKLLQIKTNTTDSKEILNDTISRNDIKNFLNSNDNKNINKDKLNRLEEAVKKFKNETQLLFIVEKPEDSDLFSGKKICDYVNKFIKTTSKKPVVFVDYLQILESNGKSYADKLSVDINIRALGKLANDNDIPVLVLSSLNRDAYNKPISFSSFKESGSIEYSADLVLGMQLAALHGKTDTKDFDAKAEMSKPVRKIETVILKNRYGQINESSFFDFHTSISFFKETNSESNVTDTAASSDTEKNPASKKTEQDSPPKTEKSTTETKKSSMNKAKHS